MWDASSSAGIRRESEKGIASVFITDIYTIGLKFTLVKKIKQLNLNASWEKKK